jgi:hypothetical protein
MKARIKGTNTIVECIKIDGFFGEKGKGVYCQYINGEIPGAYETIPGDCLIEIENDFDWQSFRAEAAKDILCSMINHFGTKYIDMDDVVKWTDSLISKLKEKEGLT